jgi:hypothetical protein
MVNEHDDLRGGEMAVAYPTARDVLNAAFKGAIRCRPHDSPSASKSRQTRLAP